MVPLDPSLLIPPDGISISRQQRRTLELLQKGSKNAPGTTSKSWSLEFYRSPTRLSPLASSSNSDLAELTLAETYVDPVTKKAVSTGKTSTLSTSLVVTSLGFHAEPMAPFFDPSVNHLRSRSGRILSPSGVAIPNLYASGWAANGAKGVLASTMMDSYAVADTILSDITQSKGDVSPTIPPDYCMEMRTNLTSGLQDDPPREVIQGIEDRVVTRFEEWKALDTEEIHRGRVLDKERERMEWPDARSFLSTLHP